MSAYTLSQLQRLREEMEMSFRLHQVAHEHNMRRLLGDDVYDFVRGGLGQEILGETGESTT